MSQWTDRPARKRLLYNARSRARQRGMECTITEQDIIVPSICPVLGIPLRLDNTPASRASSPSLDRIDNTRGYVAGNVRVVSQRANMLRNNASLDEIAKVLEDLRHIAFTK